MKKLSLFVLNLFIMFSCFAQWTEQSTGFSEPSRGINDICVVDENVVWALAYDGGGASATIQEFTKTINGGTNWTPGVVNDATGLDISMITAISADIAWVAMFKSSGSNIQGIYKTVDGGTVWTRQETAVFDASEGGFPNVIHFWDENRGFCQGDPVDGYAELYTTNDGGTTWTRVPEANIPAPVAGDEYGTTGMYDVVDATVWWTTNKGRVFKSVDYGLNWTVAVNGLGNNQGKIAMADQNNGIVMAPSNGTISATSDGGETWTVITV